MCGGAWSQARGNDAGERISIYISSAKRGQCQLNAIIIMAQSLSLGLQTGFQSQFQGFFLSLCFPFCCFPRNFPLPKECIAALRSTRLMTVEWNNVLMIIRYYIVSLPFHRGAEILGIWKGPDGSRKTGLRI